MIAYVGTTALEICPNCGQYTLDKEGYCHNSNCEDDQTGYIAYMESFGKDEVERTIFDGTPDYLRMM